MLNGVKGKKTVTIGFHCLNQDEYKESNLRRVLHQTLWNMRGQYGADNVVIFHTIEAVEEITGQDPKEVEASWEHMLEIVRVVAFKPNTKTVREEQVVYNNVTGAFDGDPFRSNIVEIINFEGNEIMVSDFTKGYLTKVVKDRIEYFNKGKYGLKYMYRNIEKEVDDTFYYDY